MTTPTQTMNERALEDWERWVYSDDKTIVKPETLKAIRHALIQADKVSGLVEALEKISIDGWRNCADGSNYYAEIADKALSAWKEKA